MVSITDISEVTGISDITDITDISDTTIFSPDLSNIHILIYILIFTNLYSLLMIYQSKI